MGRSKSSRRWLDRHRNDVFVQQAQHQGYRSRAAYKLLFIQEKDKLIGRGQVVVDLGAAPGGWSQVASHLVGPTGMVFALDLLPMAPIERVSFLQGDFRELATLERLKDQVGSRSIDLVISDMAPNFSGVVAVDQPRSVLLGELAVEFATEALRDGGDLLLKTFQGEGFEPLLKDLRSRFGKVVTRKPTASRNSSREVYLVARNYGSQ